MVSSGPAILSDSRSMLWARRLQTLEIIFFHLLVLLVPFIFSWVNDELFEFNKMLLTYFLATGILTAWAGQMVLRRQLLWKRTPLDIPLGLFLLSQIISTILSIHPYTSWYGYYSRFHGSLLSTFTYIGLYYAAVSSLTKDDALKLLRTTLIGALGAALYAIPEHFGSSPSCILITNGQSWGDSCWVQDVRNRIFGTFGQPNWLAAYVITLLPTSLITGWQAWSTKASRRVLVFSLVTPIALFLVLLFTKSRSGLVGLAGGLGVMAVGMACLIKDNQIASKYQSSLKKSLGLVVAISLVCMIWFGTPFTPSITSLWHSETASATSTTGDSQLDAGGTESGEIRKIVWLGALKVWQRYPIFGSGVETFAYSYYQDRPVAHNAVSEWDFLYNKAHNEELQFLSTTGIVGLTTYLLVLMWFGWWTLRRALQRNQDLSLFERLLLISLIAGVFGLSISNFFGFSTVMVSILMFLFFGLAVLVGQPSQKLASAIKPLPIAQTTRLKWWQIILLVAVLLTGLNGWWATANWWLADYGYAASKKLFSDGLISESLAQLSTAITRRPEEALYYDQLATEYAQLAIAYSRDKDASSSAEFNDAAVAASQETLALNSRHLNFYKSEARVYITLAELHPEYLSKAQEILRTASQLAPTDPKLRYNLGLVEETLDETNQAQQDLEAAVQLKGDYQDARLELADFYRTHHNLAAAQTQYHYILDHIAPNEPTVLSKLKEVEASMSAQPSKTTTP